jgi:hypothetical protein
MGQANVRLDGLLVSTDQALLRVVEKILDKCAIEIEVCDDLDSATFALTHRRFDITIVDWNDHYQPPRIVGATRRSSQNSNSTIVAVVERGTEMYALLAGANFMIHKPLNLDSASRCMRAAYGTMLQQRRRAARVPVNLPAVLRIMDGDQIGATICDISIGGVALTCNRALHISRSVSMSFCLPGSDRSLFLAGTVVNEDGTGRIGIRYSFVSEEDRTVLQEWLAAELALLDQAEIPLGIINNDIQ